MMHADNEPTGKGHARNDHSDKINVDSRKVVLGRSRDIVDWSQCALSALASTDDDSFSSFSSSSCSCSSSCSSSSSTAAVWKDRFLKHRSGQSNGQRASQTSFQGVIGDMEGEYRTEDRRLSPSQERRVVSFAEASIVYPSQGGTPYTLQRIEDSSSDEEDQFTFPHVSSLYDEYSDKDDETPMCGAASFDARLMKRRASIMLSVLVFLVCGAVQIPSMVTSHQKRVMQQFLQPTETPHSLSSLSDVHSRTEVAQHRTETDSKEATEFIYMYSPEKQVANSQRMVREGDRVLDGPVDTSSEVDTNSEVNGDNVPVASSDDSTTTDQVDVKADTEETSLAVQKSLNNELVQTSLAQEGRHAKLNVLKLYPNMADLTALHEQFDTPVLWHIPKSGSTAFKEVFSECMGHTVACGAGSRFLGEDRVLQTFNIDDRKYVNVDTLRIDGLKEAGRLGLASSRLANVVVVSHVHEANEIFSPSHRGRMFALFRDPIERAVSLFCHHVSPKKGPDLDASMTLSDYAREKLSANNWMTRFLSNERKNPVTSYHLEIAKEALKRKFLVGLHSKPEESMSRFQTYFGWTWERMGREEERRTCSRRILEDSLDDACFGDRPNVDDETYKVLLEYNKYDVELYNFAKELFELQGMLFARNGDGNETSN